MEMGLLIETGQVSGCGAGRRKVEFRLSASAFELRAHKHALHLGWNVPYWH